MRLPLLLALLSACAGGLFGASPSPPPALVLTLEGGVQYMDRGRWLDVQLGQLFGPGDRLRTGADGRLLLGLDAGRSLALEADSQVALKPAPPGGGLGLDVEAGRVDVLADGGAADFPVGTPNARVRIQGSEVELWVETDATQVTVGRGRALLGDKGGRRQEAVAPLECRRLGLGRLLAAEPLAKREIFQFNDRW